MMSTISAYIIAYNEAEKIEAAVLSVLWADEIVVADSGSTDGTAEIATVHGSIGYSVSMRTNAAPRRCATRSWP